MHNIQEVIFDSTKPIIEHVPLACDAQMIFILNCKNLTIEENDEDPRNIMIP